MKRNYEDEIKVVDKKYQKIEPKDEKPAKIADDSNLMTNEIWSAIEEIKKLACFYGLCQHTFHT